MTMAEQRAHHHGSDIAAASPAEAGQSRDSVCGVPVDPTTAKYRTKHAGVDQYFCSPECQAKFIAEPSKYSKPGADAPKPPAQNGVIYTCPMHPQIRRSEPGNCPICGMALEPMRPTPGWRSQRRIDRHDAPLLDRRGAGGAARDPRNGRRIFPA